MGEMASHVEVTEMGMGEIGGGGKILRKGRRGIEGARTKKGWKLRSEYGGCGYIVHVSWLVVEEGG